MDIERIGLGEVDHVVAASAPFDAPRAAGADPPEPGVVLSWIFEH